MHNFAPADQVGPYFDEVTKETAYPQKSVLRLDKYMWLSGSGSGLVWVFSDCQSLLMSFFCHGGSF